MARGTRRLYRELVRHTLASLIAGAVALAALLAAPFVAPDAVTGESATAAALTLVFGAYGPAFLLLSHLAFRGLEGDQLRARLRRSEERSGFVRFIYLGGPKSWAALVVTIGVLSILLLAASGSTVDPWLIAACVFGVTGTWVLLVAVFAVEHMRSWAEHGDLRFPGTDERRFGDFLYLSIHLSTALSSSDVQLTGRAARSLASVQSVVAFAYGTVVIAVFASLLITVTV